MKRLAVVVFLAFGAIGLGFSGLRTILADAACSLTVDNTTPLSTHLGLAPGAVLCLRGGVYSVSQLLLQASGTATARITVRSAAGEQAILKATGTGGVLNVRGSYWTFQNIVLDNSRLFQAAISVAAIGDHFELLNSEVRNGYYYGVDIWGPNARIEGNNIHNFEQVNQDNSTEIHCVATHSSASGLILRSNTIHDCWGDGLQMYEPDVYKDPSLYAHDVLIENNTFTRGSLVYGSNAIDIKGVVNGVIRNNDISGYALPSGVLLHQDQMAVELHHGAQGVLIEGNKIHDSYEGLAINSTVSGQLQGVVVRNNTFSNLTNYGITVEGLYTGGLVQYNTIVNGGASAMQIAGQGIVGSHIDHNLIVTSGQSKVYSGAIIQSSTIGPNAWYSSSRLGAFISPVDIVGQGDPGVLPGYGVQVSSGSASPVPPSATVAVSATAAASATRAAASATAVASSTAAATATTRPASSPTSTLVPNNPISTQTPTTAAAMATPTFAASSTAAASPTATPLVLNLGYCSLVTNADGTRIITCH